MECKYFNFIYKVKIGKNGYFVLRIIVKVRYKFLKNFRREMRKRLCDKVSREFGCLDDGSYILFDYFLIYCFVIYLEDRSVGDLFRRIVMVIFLLKIF